MKQYSENYIAAGGKKDFSSYYSANYTFAKFDEGLQNKMIFATHNLVSDRSFNEFQLILCRNVLIYFDKDLQENVLKLFDNSLEPLCYLALGAKETLRFSSIAKKYQQLPGKGKDLAKNSMSKSYEILIIGGSAGSLDILLQFVPRLNKDLNLAIVIVLHRKSGQDSTLVDLFSSKTEIPVKEVEEKEPVSPNTIYIAPADYHLLFERDRTFALDASEKVNHSRPSIDVSFASAAGVYGDAVCGLLLSGANADGAEGLAVIKENGGLTTIQDPAMAEVSFMPQAALSAVEIDRVLKNDEVASFFNQVNS